MINKNKNEIKGQLKYSQQNLEKDHTLKTVIRVGPQKEYYQLAYSQRKYSKCK